MLWWHYCIFAKRRGNTICLFCQGNKRILSINSKNPQIIQDIDNSSNVFSDAIVDIKNCIEQVQGVPENGTLDSEEILKHVEQTELTTQELADIVDQNKQNAAAIQEIVERFSDYAWTDGE